MRGMSDQGARRGVLAGAALATLGLAGCAQPAGGGAAWDLAQPSASLEIVSASPETPSARPTVAPSEGADETAAEAEIATDVTEVPVAASGYGDPVAVSRYATEVLERTNLAQLSTTDFYFPPVPSPTDIHADGSPWCTNEDTAPIAVSGTPIDLTGALVTASSADVPAVGSDGAVHNFGPENAVDLSREVWRVAGDGANEWIEITLPTPQVITSVSVRGSYSEAWDTGTVVEMCQHRPVRSVRVEAGGYSVGAWPYVYNGMQGLPINAGAAVTTVRVTIIESLDTGAEQNVAIEEIVLFGKP